MHRPIHNITQSAIFMTLGVLFPIFFHFIGLGSVLLPMFWPLVMAPFFVKPVYSALIGLLTPLLSSLITGMPPVPFLYIMMIELSVLSASIGWMYHNTNWGSFWIICVGMTISRFMLYLMGILLSPLLGLPKQMSGYIMILKSFPGTVMILFVIPYILYRLNRSSIFKCRKLHVYKSSGIF